MHGKAGGDSEKEQVKGYRQRKSSGGSGDCVRIVFPRTGNLEERREKMIKERLCM
jgi:hypothetical protein